jgi:hypothetical protein
MGLDNLMLYYVQNSSVWEELLLADFKSNLPAAYGLSPYISSANDDLLNILANKTVKGVTITAPGFMPRKGEN